MPASQFDARVKDAQTSLKDTKDRVHAFEAGQKSTKNKAAQSVQGLTAYLSSLSTVIGDISGTSRLFFQPTASESPSK